MKALRIAEVWSALLAAWGWAAWPVAPPSAAQRRALQGERAAVDEKSGRDRERRRQPFDDLQ